MHSYPTVTGKLENEETNSGLSPEQNRYREQLEGGLVDKLIRDWVHNAIQSSIMLSEFVRFMNSARAAVYGQNTFGRARNDSDPRQKSLYEISPEDYNGFISAYARRYPKLYRLIEGIKNKELPDKIAKKIEWASEQTLCNADHTISPLEQPMMGMRTLNVLIVILSAILDSHKC